MLVRRGEASCWVPPPFLHIDDICMWCFQQEGFTVRSCRATNTIANSPYILWRGVGSIGQNSKACSCFWYWMIYLAAYDVELGYCLLCYIVVQCMCILACFWSSRSPYSFFKRSLAVVVCVHISSSTLVSHAPPHFILLFEFPLYLFITLCSISPSFPSSCLFPYEPPNLWGCQMNHADLKLKG